MALLTGSRIGPYEVTGTLGAGGMGEVYRARDARLGRDVALKVLPEEFANDPDRLARFQREAQVLASLNHPHIAAIHGLEESGGVRALVLELVEGETLADRIRRGAIPIDEALPIATQIAEALEAAHEHGVVHRDLKPSNIKITPDGVVKVLDFGLAKLGPAEAGHYVRPDVTNSPTITAPLTMTGVGTLLGTAAYMAPEQAKGRPADKRSDVWAFGCVLYEMLTGTRAFDGDDVADTLAAVLRAEPDWGALPAEVPPAIRDLIQRALKKDRRARIADIAVALYVFQQPARGAAVQPSAGRDVFRGHRRAAILVAAVAVVVALAFGWWEGLRTAPAPAAGVTRFVLQLSEGESFTNAGRNLVALSPDGASLVYMANNQLTLRRLDQLETTAIRSSASAAVSPRSARGPFFSPDGNWVGFWEDGQIRKVALAGGAPVAIGPAANASGGEWLEDGTILLAEGPRIVRLAEGGGTPEVVVKDVNGITQTPGMLPGGTHILFTFFPRSENPGQDSEIVVRSLATGEQETILRGGIDARYVPSGHLVYYAAGTLLAVPFDAETRRVTGAPVPIAENVASSPLPGRADGNGMSHWAVSPTGTLAYVSGTFIANSPRTITWVDRAGREEPLAAPPRPYVYPRLSPDGSRLALTVRDQENDIWIWDFARRTMSRFTFDAADERYSLWTPDGRRLAFGSTRGAEAGVWWQSADGTGAPERLAAFPLNRYLYLLPTAITPDGARIVATGTPGGGGTEGPRTPDLWVVQRGSRDATPLLVTEFAERNAELSSDGRWLAYESSESGRFEVYVRPFPDVTGGKWQVSTDGGTQPQWAPQGGELFYVTANGGLMSARIDARAPLAIGTPSKVLDGPYAWGLAGFSGRGYDVSADGRRFLMLKETTTAGQSALPTRMIVVRNWFEELKRIAPAN